MRTVSYKRCARVLRTGIWFSCILVYGCIIVTGLQPSQCTASSSSANDVSSGSAKTTESSVYMPLLSEPGAADNLISLDFDQVDLRIFIKTIGHLTGINFLIDDKVRGTVTLMSPTKIRVGEVYDVLESVLQVKGYAAVPAGRIVKIISRTDAVKSNILIRVGNNPELIPVDDSLVTQVIPLHFADGAEISSVLSPLVSTGGSITTYPKTNTIIITDTSSNVHRIAKLAQELDIEQARETVTVIRLKHGSARTISDQITQIMQRGAVRTGIRSARTASPRVPAMMKIIPDDRTNSLVIVADPDDIEIISDLVATLDVERPIEAGNVHVIYLEHAEAKELEQSLSAVLGKLTAGIAGKSTEPLQITADESTNSLIVVASPQDFKVIEDMIQKLDIVREQVLIEFQIIEASSEVLKEIGVDWATLNEAVADSVRGFGFTNLGPRIEAASGNLEGLGVGVYKKVGDQTSIGAILKALEKHSGVNILSTPHILTSNHQEATIVVADNVPYVKQSRVTEFDPATPTAIRTFDFKDVGIELSVTPHVSQGGFVRLEIDASFTKLVEGATGLGSETPTTSQRKITTVISIMSGTTVVIGGLIRDDKEEVEKKIPLLGDIPLIGGLFRVTRERMQKTNLLLFITPHVLVNMDDLVEITSLKRKEMQD